MTISQITAEKVEDLVYRIGCRPGITEDGRKYFYLYAFCSPDCGNQAFWTIVVRDGRPKSLGAFCGKCRRLQPKELEELFEMAAVLSPTQQTINQIESEAIYRLRGAESTEATFHRLIGAK